ncbi:MAG TPA: AraC family transcriptional regulator [Trichocoleus sp.]
MSVASITTRAEFEAQWQASMQTDDVAFNVDGFEYIGRCQHRFSHDFFWRIQLRPGLSVEYCDDAYQETLNLQVHHTDTEPITAKFYLAGHHRVLTPGWSGLEDYQEHSGQHYLFYLPNLDEIECNAANQRLQLLRVCYDPSFLRSFGAPLESLPEPLQQVLEQGNQTRFYQPLGALTPQMRQCLQQIVHCPYSGVIKRMYLESRVLELLSLQLLQWPKATPSAPDSKVLRKDDVERLHQAKSLLLRQADQPPSIAELARQVGLNEYKLKLGFQQVFGTTVFGCLRSHRMMQAKQFLADDEMSVAGVAQAVGYTSQSRFCDAFKRAFGVTPRDYRRYLRG